MGSLLHNQNNKARKRKGQALLELALTGLMLGMLLAGAVDLGRAYYISVVVANMAGEGAAYAANHPDQELGLPSPPNSGYCSADTVPVNYNIQDRARRVAIDRGTVISVPNIQNITVTPVCRQRVKGASVTVKVSYAMTDLFLPSILGMNSITINKTATQYLTKDAYCAAHSCP